MRFEVVDRVEAKRGLIFKKPSFECEIKIDLTDDEVEGLESYCTDPYMESEIIGHIHHLHHTKDTSIWDITAGSILYSVNDNAGIYKRNIVKPTLASREGNVEMYKDVAKKLKEIIVLGFQLKQDASLGDTSEEF